MLAMLPDDFATQETVAKLRRALGSDELAAANTTRLDGARVSPADLVAATSALPFFGDRRLVIVRGLLARHEPKSAEAGGGRRKAPAPDREGFLQDWLSGLPPSTDLVFIEEQVPAAQSPNPLVRAIVAAGGTVRESRQLSAEEAMAWVQTRASQTGCTVSDEAAGMLVDAKGSDLRALDLELFKLATYADGAQITAVDVRQLVSDDHQESIFVLVDAIGRRDRRLALRTLHTLLATGSNELYLLTMIGRQIRLLLQVTAAMEESTSADAVAGALRMRPWQARNYMAQARLFSAAQLQHALGLVLSADRDIKTGVCSGEVALDLLVATLAGPQPESPARQPRPVGGDATRPARPPRR